MTAKEPVSINPTNGYIDESRATGDSDWSWFSERFTALPDFGTQDIPCPGMLLQVFAATADDELPSLNIGDTPEKSGLRHIAEMVPRYMGEAFPVSWLSTETCNLPSVAEGIARVLAYIAMTGILAEATWRCQVLQAEKKYKPTGTYAEQIQDVLCRIIAANSDCGPFSEGLNAALDVGASVIAEFLQDANVSLGQTNATDASELGEHSTETGGADADEPMPRPYQQA